MFTQAINTRSFNPYLWLLAVIVSFTLMSFSLIAGEAVALPTPEGRVLLTITGNIGITNSGTNSAMDQPNQAEFDLALLDSLPQHEFLTETPWTTGVHRFSGVLVTDLLARVDAKGPRVKAMAYNEFFSEIDIRRPELSRLLLTTRVDGQPMRIRDKGPTWLMLPLSDAKELNNKRYHELLIWQLRTLDVQ